MENTSPYNLIKLIFALVGLVLHIAVIIKYKPVIMEILTPTHLIDTVYIDSVFIPPQAYIFE